MYARTRGRTASTPVLTYYMLLQSKPAGGDEAHADLTNLRDPATMAAYWADVRLLFQRMRGTKPVVVHVEPDLWGYLEQAGDSRARVVVRAAVGQAPRRPRAERDPRLPHERLGHEARHRLRGPARRDGASLRGTVGHVLPLACTRTSTSPSRTSPTATPASTRRSSSNPKTWFTPADFHRHLLYAPTFVQLAGVRMVAWQIPLGNTLMRAMNNTWDHFQDNRVQWLLGSRAHLRAYVNAGFVGFLFGRGADGTTCACDSAKDGVTNPAPINGNTRARYERRRRRRPVQVAGPFVLRAARSATPVESSLPPTTRGARQCRSASASNSRG